MVYVLDPARRAELIGDLVRTAQAIDGVDLVLHRDGDGRGVIATGAARDDAGELRFAPGDDVRDGRGGGWVVEGDLHVLGATVEGGRIETGDYPDALARAWAALTCEASGEVLLSAGPGAEFPDWGGAAHVGGSSHGSLHRADSLGALAFCGITPPKGFPAGGRWAIHDTAYLCLAHHRAVTLSGR